VTSGRSEVVVRWIRADEVTAYRDFRLRALADAPDAFGEVLADAQTRPIEAWEDRVRRASAGVDSVLLVAADPATDAWLGMTGCYLDEDDPTVAHVVSVWVAPMARRRGLAGRMVAGARTWAASRGVRTLRLWVTATKLGAKRVYLAAGFVPTGRTQPLPSNPALQEVEMASDARACSVPREPAAG
jgi:GNAT superfamily N-acetyltransferase